MRKVIVPIIVFFVFLVVTILMIELLGKDSNLSLLIGTSSGVIASVIMLFVLLKKTPK
ncbi:MAG: hypothetical protein U9R08_02295 [Nanoarchaeota archaeon]|nr:hypothetical protein [Nanoarchaeota archaeon]